MSEEIIKVLDNLCEKFGVVIDWSSENVLPYAQQVMEKFVTYELWTSVAIVILWFIIFVICALITRKGWQNADEDCWDDGEPSFWITTLGILFTVLFGFVLICVACKQTFDIITCLTFPEKLIFDLLINMK